MSFIVVIKKTVCGFRWKFVSEGSEPEKKTQSHKIICKEEKTSAYASGIRRVSTETEKRQLWFDI